MSTSVKEIEKVGSIDRRKSAKEKLWNRRGYESALEEEQTEDSVIISEEARNRASGRHRKTILEHIAADDGGETS